MLQNLFLENYVETYNAKTFSEGETKDVCLQQNMVNGSNEKTNMGDGHLWTKWVLPTFLSRNINFNGWWTFVSQVSALINDGLPCTYSSPCSHRFGVNDSNNLRKFLTWFSSNSKLHCSVFLLLVKLGYQIKYALRHICPSSSLQIKAYPEEKKKIKACPRSWGRSRHSLILSSPQQYISNTRAISASSQ